MSASPVQNQIITDRGRGGRPEAGQSTTSSSRGRAEEAGKRRSSWCEPPEAGGQRRWAGSAADWQRRHNGDAVGGGVLGHVSGAGRRRFTSVAVAQVGGGAGDTSKTTRRCRPSAVEPPPVKVSPPCAQVNRGASWRRRLAAAGVEQAELCGGGGARCPPATGGDGSEVCGARGR